MFKPEVSVDSIKSLVKKYKKQGFQVLTHHDLALALVTIGFEEVCKQFGAKWSKQNQENALHILNNSEYDLKWFGCYNNTLYASIFPLISRGDIEKTKNIIRTVNSDMKLTLITTVDNFKRSPLHLAVKEDFDVLAEYLIQEGFSVKARDRELKTPLHYCKNELICYVLLKNGSSIIAKDNKYCTPAHYAAGGTNFKVIQAMLQKTNVVNQIDATGKSPIFYAIFNTNEDQINILRILAENGANVNNKDAMGRTPLHYACEMGKIRCIPFLLQKGASLEIRDNHNKIPLDLASSQKVRKMLTVYGQNKGIIFEKQQQKKRDQFDKIKKSNIQIKSSTEGDKTSNAPIYTKELNQVSTWIREKFFVLMKKLQEAGVRSSWHVKRPYIYTGSWAEDINSLQDLYQTYLDVSGPEAAMRTFNILCPYEKSLPTVLGKAEEAFQSFFGQNWFSKDPIQKVRNMHSHNKIKTQFQKKTKEAENLNLQLLGYRAQMDKLQNIISTQKQQLHRYQKIQEDLRKERAKNTAQYTQLLQNMTEKQELKNQIKQLIGGEQKTQILLTMIEQLRDKNEDLMKELQKNKLIEVAARRKCGQIFLKSLQMINQSGTQFKLEDQDNLYDDDAIISLYGLLRDNPPNLQGRFSVADRKRTGKLSVDEFTRILENLSMLPQDIMSMHRIVGFAFGRKTLSLEEFKTILQNRHKNRPLWEKKLIRKLKQIIIKQGMSIAKFFKLIDKDGNGTIEATELRKGLENYNIFMNQNDWNNLFNLLDSDKSGQIDLVQLQNLMKLQATGKLQGERNINKIEQEQKQEQNQLQKNKEDQQQKKQQILQKQQEEENHEAEISKKSEDFLLKSEIEAEQFKQEYEEKSSDQDRYTIKLNGQIKIQIPLIKFPQNSHDKIYVRFIIADFEMVKMADMTLPKLSIAVKFQMIEYKVLTLQNFKMQLGVFASRNFDEENYLGETEIPLGIILDKPKVWALNAKYELQASEWQKQVEGIIVVQGKWLPEEE